MISSHDMARMRRQMQRRIRDVVAERRLARLASEPNQPDTGEPESTTDEEALLIRA